LTPRVAHRKLCSGEISPAVLQQFHKQAGREPVLQDIHQRALRRAAEILGGNEGLRIHLGASEAEFASWSSRRELPRDIFLRLVDIITEEEVRSVRSYRAPRRALASS
jgi:hypothetical protein